METFCNSNFITLTSPLTTLLFHFHEIITVLMTLLLVKTSPGFILECRFAGFPQFEKKMPHEIYVGASNGVHKIVSNFWNKVFENITDDKIDMTATLYFDIYSLFLSQLHFPSSFVSVFVYTFLSCFWVILFFFHAYIMIIIIKKTGKVTICERQEPLFYETNIWDSAVTWVQAFPVAPLLGPLS